jgi:Patatin-like phospholipase
VSAVVFGPDLPARRSHPSPRIGLVFGAGGVLGAAWMTGALARLQDRLPGTAADVDLVVGTSAGSVLAAALRCRASFDEIKHVTIVTPGPRDLAVMGANLMDPRRRPDVLEVSLRTSADSLATLDRVSSRAA